MKHPYSNGNYKWPNKPENFCWRFSICLQTYCKLRFKKLLWFTSMPFHFYFGLVISKSDVVLIIFEGCVLHWQSFQNHLDILHEHQRAHCIKVPGISARFTTPNTKTIESFQIAFSFTASFKSSFHLNKSENINNHLALSLVFILITIHGHQITTINDKISAFKPKLYRIHNSTHFCTLSDIVKSSVKLLTFSKWAQRFFRKMGGILVFHKDIKTIYRPKKLCQTLNKKVSLFTLLLGNAGT